MTHVLIMIAGKFGDPIVKFVPMEADYPLFHPRARLIGKSGPTKTIEQRPASRDEMRGYDVDELARRDNLGTLPELREMSLVAGHQIVRASRVRTFQKLIIVGIFRHIQRSAYSNRM
jgi:hypothetical protein